MNKKKIIATTLIITLIIIFVLWISGIIPKQIARISAANYLKKHFPKIQLEYLDIEWSSSFGGYSIKFKDENNEIYGFIMNNKYFPIELGQGLFGFEEKYKEKYEKQKTENINEVTGEDKQTEITWEEITADGVNEELLLQNTDVDILEEVAKELQLLVDEAVKEERDNPEILFTEGWARVFEYERYKKVINIGKPAMKPLYLIIYKRSEERR